VYTPLSEAKLKTGEPIEVGLAQGPDEEHAEQIKPFLAHKGGNWNWHVARSVSEELDGLETRFYLAKLNGEIISNVMTVECAHAGILGHVFTDPTHRRKGAVSRVFDQLMPDLQKRGGVLTLGTGFESPAYWIYHSYGFRSIVENTGFMRYATEENYEDDSIYVPSPANVRPLLWRDWPRFSLLASRDRGWHLRSLWLGHYGPSNFEGPFLALKRAVEEGSAQCVVSETEAGAVVGYAALVRDNRWGGHTWLLDVDAHARFAQHTVELLKALDYPSAKTQCHVDGEAHAKAAALRDSGFRHEATFRNQIERGGKAMDVVVYAKGDGMADRNDE